jgi:PhnB protein
MIMPQPVPYLSFNGNCVEAMRFYEKVLGAEMKALISYGDSPMCDETPKEAHHLIMHAYLVQPDGGALMAGDTPPGMPYNGIEGVMLTLSYATQDEATRVFNALAEGGKITMPLAPTFWAKTFGMVTDRFGVGWGINGEEIPV